MNRYAVTFFILISLAYGEGEDLDTLFEGFEENSVDMKLLEADKSKTVPYDSLVYPYGAVSYSTSYNYAHQAPANGETDYRGFSRARTKADVGFDSKLPGTWQAKAEFKLFYDAIYSLRDRNDYTDDTLKTYESEAEIKEAYVLGSLTDTLDLKIGRQIVVWGKSDNLRLTDVINPLDNREPGMVDIEDLRLPVGMAKLDYYHGPWNLSTMAILENRVQKEAAIGSEFFPVQIFPFPPGFVFPEDETPEQELGNGQYAVALNGRFSGWDLSLYKAKVLDSRWHFEEQQSVRRYSQVDMAGAALNIAWGNFLVKAEAARFDGLRYNTVSGTKMRLNFLGGIEYQGFPDTVISYEESVAYLPDHEKVMLNAPDFTDRYTSQHALRVNYSFNHDRGSFTYLYTLNTSSHTGNSDFSSVDGGFQRGWVEYELGNAVEATVGAVDYLGGEKPFFEAIKNNDRIFADITYSF